MKSLELVSYCKVELASVGISDYLEAEWLVALALSVPFSDLYKDFDVEFGDLEKVRRVLDERKKGRPLAYIIGTSEFFGREFETHEGVLIPRPETELLVEEVIKIAKKKPEVRILDIGTGSGVIAITLALETDAKVTAVDISDEAIRHAKLNSEKLGADINIQKSDLFENVNGRFDIIVSNPPYIKTKVIDTLDKCVKDFEPMLALDGGDDGLNIYRKIVESAPKFLSEEGYIAFEIGYDQADDLKGLLEKDFENIKIIKDYSKNDRVVIAKLR